MHEQQKNLNYEGLDLGFVYHSKAVQSENDQMLSVLPNKYIPTTLPGSRAPYVNLIKNGKKISTLDLFEKEFILLIGPEGEPWRIAANQLAEALAFPLITYSVAREGDLIDSETIWHDAYNLSTQGAVLVRPDGHVAWRRAAIVENPKVELEKCLNAILG